MRAVILLLLAAISPSVATVRAEQTPPPRTLATPFPNDGRPFVVRLAEGMSADTCSVDPYQTYQQGAALSSGVEAARTDRGAIVIPTAKNARALKAVIWCQGFSAAVIDVPALATSKYESSISPKRLRTLPISGRILPAGALTLVGQDLRIRFEAWWACGFFAVQDCMVPTFPVGTAKIKPDGTFTFELPDVLSDPIAKSYQLLGGFAMDVEEPAPSYRHYRLESPSGPTLLPAAAYPEPIVLTIKQ